MAPVAKGKQTTQFRIGRDMIFIDCFK
jgi:hypothetical protein